MTTEQTPRAIWAVLVRTRVQCPPKSADKWREEWQFLTARETRKKAVAYKKDVVAWKQEDLRVACYRRRA